MTVRLSTNSFAGTARTLVAVGTARLASMLATTREAAPRKGRCSPLPAAAGGGGGGAGAGGGFAAAGSDVGLAVGVGSGAGFAGAVFGGASVAAGDAADVVAEVP